MENFAYPVKLERAEEGGFTVTFPDVPGAITEADDEEEAVLRAADALETILAAYVKDGKPLPRPRRARGRVRTVKPSALSCMKLAVYQAMQAQGVGKAALGRRLGWHLPQVDRILDLMHASKVEQVEAALAVLGLSVRVEIEKAA
jgi:antitoxin HicB